MRKRMPQHYGAARPVNAPWVQELDRVAAEAERIWGVDRLPLLISPEQRARWQRQQDKLDEAIQSGDAARIEQACAATIRGYAALIREAEANGHKPLEVTAWEAPMVDGLILAVVQTLPEQHAHQRACARDGRRNVQVWTVEEIARVLHRVSPAHAVGDIKQAFPGAEVVQLRPRAVTAAPIDDEIPF